MAKNGYLAKPEDVSGLAEAMRLSSKLDCITTTYCPARKEQFTELFK